MTQPVGLISMVFARPFGRAEFPLFARLKAAGFDFIELLVPEPGELDPKETRAALQDAGLGVVLAARVNLERDLASKEAGARAAGLRYLHYCADAAKALGASIVGGPLYGAPLVFAGRAPQPIDEAWRQRRNELVALALRDVADRGITWAVEPLNRFETDFLNHTAQGLELMAMVDRPSVGLMLDTFHMAMDEDDIAGAIRMAGRHLVHFQANENHRGPLGTGHLDWKAIRAALADYTGPVTFEPFRRPDQRLGVTNAQWRPPEKDPLPASVKGLKTWMAAAPGAAP